jgi:hypothetical protein
MMKVFVLLLYTKHEGFENVGVYEAWESAEEAQKDINDLQWYDIEEWEVQ